MSPSPRSLLHERGAALVEAALILPLFFALVLGMITFGDAYFTRISLEDAVRDGARFGAVMDTFDSNTVKTRVVGLSGDELELADVCAELVPNAAAGDTTCDVATPAGSDGEDIVKVSAKTGKRVEYIFNAFEFDVVAKSAALYEAG